MSVIGRRPVVSRPPRTGTWRDAFPDEFWEEVDRCAAEVATWPPWKRGEMRESRLDINALRTAAEAARESLAALPKWEQDIIRTVHDAATGKGQ